MSKCQKYSGIGGQAVIEGIMMRNGDEYATAVRKPDGDIVVDKKAYISMTKRYKILGIPFIRGIFAFIDSLILGMRTLTYSASFFEDDEDAKPSKLEEKLQKIFGDKLESIIMGIVMVISFVLALAIFMLLPLWISSLLQKIVPSYYIRAILEGIIRIMIFIIYIKIISHMNDINRTFMYHGSEHKCINCIEHGLPLTVDNVMASSKEHKRCGTSFILIVMVISILFFMVIRVDNPMQKALSRILLIPVIAGISYEFLRWTGTHDSMIVKILIRPGMWMQSLTTKEPTRDMAEVAIQAVEAVFDWKKYLKDNFDYDDSKENL